MSQQPKSLAEIEDDPKADLTANALSQHRSPLFRLLWHLRRIIYDLAFPDDQGHSHHMDIDGKPFDDSECSKPDDFSSLPDWNPPDSTTSTKVCTEFMGTCKLAYSETSSIPAASIVHRCYQGYGLGPGSSEYMSHFTESQLSEVRQLHLFTQVVDFDTVGLWLRKELEPVPDCLQHLTITLRDLDGLPDRPSLIHPFRRGVANRPVKDECKEKVRARGSNLNMPKMEWGDIFAHFPALRTLTLELEVQESRESDLEDLVNWANQWSFPLNGSKSVVSKTTPSRHIWRRILRHHRGPCGGRRHKHLGIITYTMRWDAPTTKQTVRGEGTARKQDRSLLTKPKPKQKPKPNQKPKSKSNRTSLPDDHPMFADINSIIAHASKKEVKRLAQWGVL